MLLAALIVAADALWLECGRAGLLSRAPRRLALDATIASLLWLASRMFGCGWRALLKPSGAFLLGLALFCANTRPLWSGDTESAFLLPFSLVREHSFSLDGVACTGPNAPPMYAATRGADGRLWSRYPIMTGLFALPLELPAALSRFDACAPVARDLEKISAAILAALMLALLSSALRTIVDEEEVAALALLAWTVGTAALPVLGQALWQHTGTALGAALAIRALCFRARSIASKKTDEDHLRLVLQLGLGAGLAVACRPPDFPIALALLWGWARLDRARGLPFNQRLQSIAPALAVAAVPVAIHLAYQWQAFGGPFHTGYGDEAVQGWTFAAAPIQLLGLLVSPGRGLLVWSPILLIAILPLIKLPPAPLAPALRVLAIGLAVQILIIASWWAWHGGSTFGPRMHAGGLPLFAPLLALGFEALQTSTRRMKIAAVGLAAMSILPTAMITFVPPPRAAAEACLHLHAPGGAWSALAWPPRGYFP